MADGAAYRGDDTLAALLAAAGARLTAEDVRDLTEGTLAAPEDMDPRAWHVLVVGEPTAELADQLDALRAELRAAREARRPALGSAPKRLRALREELGRRGLDGFIVPRGDEHQGEWVPPGAERLAWLTGFTGSAGLAIVLRERAALFVDGRYTLQARSQTDTSLFAPHHLVDDPPDRWIEANLAKGVALGFDPWLHSEDAAKRYRGAAELAGGRLVASDGNPVDAVWGADRPPAPIAPIRAHELSCTGRSAAEKRAEIAAELSKRGVDAAVLTAPDSIAWLLNIRGGDVPNTPLPLAFAIVHADGGVELFCDPRKLTPGLAEHLGNRATVKAPDEFDAALGRLGAAGGRVLADPATAAAHVFERLRKAAATIVRGVDPCALPKACKNEVELAGARAAHRRDGAALVRFLAWLGGEAPKGTLTESAAAARLAAFRREGEHYRGASFDTIAGAGPNGAIVHYRVDPESDRRLEPGSLFLLDSGGQYLDGTTDVTRTVAIGPPDGEMRANFTRVLKGHIALASVRFPQGTTGSQLDILARLPLWAAGLDYDHGTGHGVGSYLGVHEGPQRISKLANKTALRAGMILSNEPGYYKEGAYGIRIENLVAVAPDDAAGSKDGSGRAFLRFETLTLAPIDLALVEPEMLSEQETAWLDAYHARVRERLTPLLDIDTAAWLDAATRPVRSSR